MFGLFTLDAPVLQRESTMTCLSLDVHYSLLCQQFYFSPAVFFEKRLASAIWAR